MDTGFPEMSDSFLAGQDLLYAQFNEVEFYVEDTDQEHLYFNIFKSLFRNLKFEKIFPLNGKKNVTDAAKINLLNKKKIFLVDLDFDLILEKKEFLPNLFYLKKYSIENYLFSKHALFEIIRTKDPKLKDSDIEQLFDSSSMLEKIANSLIELCCSFILIQKHEMSLSFFGINPRRDFDYSLEAPHYRQNFVNKYLNSVESELKKIDLTFLLIEEYSVYLEHFDTIDKALSNIPGKFILTILKDVLYQLNLSHQMTLESFTYLLSKEFISNDLDYLKVEVKGFMMN